MTVEEALRQSGMTEEQIKALDANALKGFNTILTTAQTAEQTAKEAREAAERSERAQKQMYSNEIAPALDTWATEKANMEARIAFYEKQNEEAKKNGFIATAPPGTPAATPGSPVADPNTGKYLTLDQARSELYTGLTVGFGIQNEYMRLFGQPMPDDFTVLLKEATDQRLPIKDYAARKYGFDAKRNEIAAAKQKEHDDAIRKEESERVRKEIAERGGSNPNMRAAESSKFSSISQATQKGERKDPLTLTPEQRREQTRQTIHRDIKANATIQ